MKIDTTNWKEFRVGDLFNGVSGDTDIKQHHINDKGLPVITSGLSNNGLLGLSDVKAKVISQNTITVDMFGNAFYRNYDYKMVTHARVFALIPKFDMTVNTGLYFATILFYLPNKFDYSNMCSYEKIKDDMLLLPAIDPDTPDFDYMEEYIEEMKFKYIDELEKDNDLNIDKALEVTGLSYEDLDKDLIVESADKYEEFNYNDFYDLLLAPFYVGGESLSSSGKYPVYSATSDNFGIQGYSNIQPAFIVDEDNPYYIVFGDHTKTFNFAYNSFSTKDNVKTLRPKFKSKAINLYLLTVWSKAIPSLGYARHWSKAKKAKLLLPAKDCDTPDFDYMEKAIYIYIYCKKD